jgi:hypothetical protein
MNLGNIGALVMHRIRCIAASAEGGFKTNNGPSTKDKGPMSQGNNIETRDETSPPQPTQAGRIETCTELIRQAMRCLENNDKDCVMRLIEELIKADCHDGRLIGKEVADGVRGLVHELWSRDSDNYGLRCKLLMLFRSLDVSKSWIRNAMNMSTKTLNKWSIKCGIELKSKAGRINIVKRVVDLLRERFGWDEVRMCETLLKYIGVDAEVLRRYGIEPCDWVHAGFDEVYFMGIALTDLGNSETFKFYKKRKYIKASLSTTNAVDAVLFSLLLPVQPTVKIWWVDRETGIVEVGYFITVRADEWEWANYEELIKRIRTLRPEDVPRLIAGAVDGDGTIEYSFTNSTPYIKITACKACGKRVFLDALQEALGKLGIKSHIYEDKVSNGARLEVRGRNAIKLLRLITPHLRHPLKRLRAKLILMLHDGKIDGKAFTELYEQTEYKDEDKDDPKRCRAIEVLARAAPQTHTRGVDGYAMSASGPLLTQGQGSSRWFQSIAFVCCFLRLLL